MCPAIGVRRLGACQLRPAGPPVLTQPAYLLQPECSRDSSHVETVSRVPLLLFWAWHFSEILPCGWSPLALLPSHFWLQLLSITPLITRPCHKFPFLETPANCETTDVLFSHISTCLQEMQPRNAAILRLCLVCLCCFHQLKKKDWHLYFYLSRQTPSVAVGCFHFWDPSEWHVCRLISTVFSFSISHWDNVQQLCGTY